MSRKIIGVTVGTPISPARLDREIKPVKTVNGVSPDENGNVEVSGGGISDELIGDIDTALGAIIEIQNSLMGGSV